MVVVESLVDLAREPRADFGLIAVANGLNQQILQAGFFEYFAQDVEHTTF